MKTLRNIFGLGLVALTFVACSDAAEEITSIIYGRNFAPIGLEAKVRNRTNVELSWNAADGVTNYNVEVYANDSLSFTGSPVKSFSITPDQVPYTITDLEGETPYSFRVQATSEDSSRDSKWSTAFAKTDAEQIFKNVAEEDIKGTSVVLRWPAGEEAATITLNPGNIVYNITAEDIATGAATITGLTAETEYTAVMSRANGKTRGKISFKTGIDLADTDILVKAGSDIVAAINNAPEGYRLVIEPGTYGIAAEGATYGGNVAISKKITLKGLRQNDHPIIRGRITLNDGAALELDQITLDGNDDKEKPNADQAFVFKKVGDMSEMEYLHVYNSEIKNFVKGLFYIADSELSHVKEIIFNNCIVSNIECVSGDFLDCRKGAAVEVLTFSNSTVYNCCLERDFVRYDDGSSNFSALGITCNITIDHNTIVGAANTASRRILYTRFKTHTITFTNNLVTNTLANFSNQSGTAIPSFDNNVYFEANGLCVSGANSNGKFIDEKGTVLDPQFKDAAKGDFTIGNDNVKDLKVGDPRWY